MTKVTARCQNTCPFLFLHFERPAERAPLCISMHRRASLVPRIASRPRPCAARHARVARSSQHALYNLPVRERRYKCGAAQMIYRSCRSTVRFLADGTYLQIVRHLQNIRFMCTISCVDARLIVRKTQHNSKNNFQLNFDALN